MIYAQVGISNTVAGLLGGFTGSYIFSQTIFTCRSGCRSRIVGVVVVVCELVAGVTKLDLLGALPLFFFAATLAFVGLLLQPKFYALESVLPAH
jgi:SulP family sulfate permease